MLYGRYLLLLSLFLLSIVGRAQTIDNTLSFKNINSDKYLRLNFENDYFAASDFYYTQGVHLELVSPALSKCPLNNLLIDPLSGYHKYGMAIEHDIFTPTNIKSGDILYNDRPYAACLILKVFRLTVDTMNKQRFSAVLNGGILGPGALAGELQAEAHRYLPGNTVPQGWIHQVKNDAIVNYQADYEAELMSLRNMLTINWDVSARAGTLYDKASGGATLMIGRYTSPFAIKSNSSRVKIAEFYAYEHAQMNLIGYDATMQGGFFDKRSPYVINASQISRITFQNRLGFVVNYLGFHFEYFQAFLSTEFKTGNYHVWGGIQIAHSL